MAIRCQSPEHTPYLMGNLTFNFLNFLDLVSPVKPGLSRNVPKLLLLKWESKHVEGTLGNSVLDYNSPLFIFLVHQRPLTQIPPYWTKKANLPDHVVISSRRLLQKTVTNSSLRVRKYTKLSNKIFDWKLFGRIWRNHYWFDGIWWWSSSWNHVRQRKHFQTMACTSITVSKWSLVFTRLITELVTLTPTLELCNKSYNVLALLFLDAVNQGITLGLYTIAPISHRTGVNFQGFFFNCI